MRIIYLLFILILGLLNGLIAQRNSLDYFINEASRNSPLIRDYQNQIASNSLDSQIYRATLRPQVAAISNNSFAPVINGYGYDAAITNGGQLSALLSVNKSFFSNQTIASQIDRIRLQKQGLSNTIKITQQELKKTITAQYITTYGDYLQVQFNEEINGLLKKEDSILKRLTQNNVYRQSDYLAFAVTIQQQELTSAQLQIQYKFDYANLNYLSGIFDTVTSPLEDPHLRPAVLPDYEGSVFFHQYLIDSLNLINQRALINLNYRPKFNVFADAGYNSTLAYQGYKNFGTSFGFNISVPIYDGKQKQMQHSKISIAERTRLSNKDFFTRQYQQQIAQLTQQLNATDDLIKKIDKQIKYAETLITVNARLLETGDIRLTDFILTLNNYFTAKNQLNQNYISRLQIVNQLNYWNR